jgi:hypothetical protein
MTFSSQWYSLMSLSIVTITNRSAFTVPTWAALRKSMEIIWANLSDQPEAGVIIIGDMGCIAIMGVL